MPPYHYSKLDTDKQEIRLLTLLPGNFEDSIRFTISHEPFLITDDKILPRENSAKQNHNPLPPGWHVSKNYDDRTIYYFVNPKTNLVELSSWTHPDLSSPPWQDEIVCSWKHSDPSTHQDETTSWTTIEPRVVHVSSSTYSNPSSHQDISTTSWANPGTNISQDATTFAWTCPDRGVLKDDTQVSSESSIKYTEIPIFEALSYTWGSSINPVTSYVVDQHSMIDLGTLEIGQNLASALRHIRRFNTTRTLWIDALCINQNDISEREVQVPRMDAIYTHSDRVVVWLGPEFKNYEMALSALENIARRIDVTKNGMVILSPDFKLDANQNIQWEMIYGENIKSNEVATAISELLQFTWFDRLWPVQEIQLANSKATVMCGTLEIPWRSFQRALNVRIQTHSLDDKVALKLKQRWAHVAQMGYFLRDSSFRRILTFTKAYQCAVEVDKIYGILALIPPDLAKRIKPSYQLPVGEVYKTIFLEYLAVTHRLDMFGFSDINSCLPNTPSWVPNWSALNVPPTFSQYGVVFATGYSAPSTIYTPPNTLSATGVAHSTIEMVADTVFETESDLFDLVRQVGLEKLQQEKYATGESLLDAYAWTLSCCLLDDRYHGNMGYLPSLQTFKARILFEAGEGSKENMDAALAVPIEFLNNKKRGRKFFTTKDGYFGFGPGSCRPGDIVCVVLGYEGPMVFRKTSNIDEDTYEVLGECHLHGIENGECLLGTVPSPYEFRVLHTAGGLIPAYWNKTTQSLTLEDPRLEAFPLPPDWEKLERERRRSDPLLLLPHRNRVTGEEIVSDPRMLPEELRARGIELQEFRLV